MKVARITLGVLLASTTLTGCTSMVKSMYESDHALGSQHQAVVMWVADTPKAVDRFKTKVNDQLFDGVPQEKVVFTALDRYDDWSYIPNMYGWSERGEVEPGDIVGVVNGGPMRNPQRVAAVITKWNDPRLDGRALS